jgi:AcrR family transcriptional regulator
VSRVNERRYAIAAVAVELFSERGYDAVTAEEIAAAAGIGVRTFFRYFSSKEQAAFPDHEERVERFRAALHARTGSADPVEAVIEVSLANARDYFEQPDLYRPRYRLVHNEPALRDHERIADRAYELAIEEFLAKELRSTPHVQLVAPVITATLIGAVNAVLDAWALGEAADHEALLDTAQQLVRRSAHASLSAVTPTATSTTVEGPRADADVVLVVSDDPELRHQVAALVQQYRRS